MIVCCSPTPNNQTSNEGSNPPPLEDISNAPHRQNTPWPKSGSTSENLYETRKDWPIPPTPAATPTLTIKTEEPPQIAAMPHAMVMPKKATEKCSWGLHFPIYNNEEEYEEGWDGNMQTQPRIHPQNTQCPQPQTLQCPHPQNNQYPETQNFQ